jgi:hypothetical protein
MKVGTTSNGFHFEFDEARADDMRFVDLIVASMDENTPEFERITAASKMIEMLLGKEQKKALYEHLRGEDGRVHVQAVSDALTDIFGSMANGKNS